MKINIEKNLLVDALNKIVGPTTTKQNFPILSSVLLLAEENKVKFTTTDLDVSIMALQEAEVKESGTIAVPMKRFFSIARELPSEKVKIEKVKNNLLINCGKVEVKINTLDPKEFPQVQEAKGVSLIKLDPQTTEEMIRLTSFSVGYEDVNYVLNGIFFELMENKITLVSTDGKRLSVIKRSLPPNQPAIKTKISFILPVRAVNELYKLVKNKEENIFMFVEDNRVGFDCKDTQFIARPIEGEFPNYAQYIPGETKDKLRADRKELLSALRRANLLSTPDYQGVKLELRKNTLVVYKSTPQLGEVKEELDVKYEGANLEIGFNPNYLTDILKNLEDEGVCFSFFGADKPAVLKREDHIYLLLPMKT